MKKHIIISITAALLITAINVTGYAKQPINTAEEIYVETPVAETAEENVKEKADKAEKEEKEEKPKETAEPEESDNAIKDNADDTQKHKVREHMHERKQLVKEKKLETHTYLREMRSLFCEADKETRKELLEEIAAAKAELKDYRIETFVKGKCIDFEKYDNVCPIIENNRTLVPIRAIVESMDADVKWNSDTQEITISKNGIVISMIIGNTTAYVDGEASELDAAPKIKNGRTLVPARFIAESFKLGVEWDEDSKSVIIE